MLCVLQMTRQINVKHPITNFGDCEGVEWCVKDTTDFGDCSPEGGIHSTSTRKKKKTWTE